MEVGRNCWQAKLPVEENAEYVVAEPVVFIAVLGDCGSARS
jgi:hypothetical protein